jgi:hypothetical protein
MFPPALFVVAVVVARTRREGGFAVAVACTPPPGSRVLTDADDGAADSNEGGRFRDAQGG